MNEFIEQFLLEARELIAQGTGDLLVLERSADDQSKIDSVFRAFHTLKGAAGIVEFEPMARALHAAESVLSDFRTSDELISPAIIDQCLSCLDQVTRWLDVMQATGEAPADAGPAADAIVQSFALPKGPAPNSDAALPAGDWLAELRGRRPDAWSEAQTALRYVPDADAFFKGEDPLARVEKLPDLTGVELAMREPLQAFGAINPFTCSIEITALSGADTETIKQMLSDLGNGVEVIAIDSPRRSNSASELSALARSILDAQVLLLRESEEAGLAGRIMAAGRVSMNVLRRTGLFAAASAVETALGGVLASQADAIIGIIEDALLEEPSQLSPAQAQAEQARLPLAIAARVLRVDTARIDELVNLTGELTVVKNALGHLAALAQGGLDQDAITAGLRQRHAQLDRLVGEVQRAVLRIRVLPMRQTFERFPRLVREIAAGVGKPVTFDIEGDETEADKAIVESLFEPLLHVLRNAVDHGIENPQRRAASGKPPAGAIVLRASRHLDTVIVEVADDGAGVDTARVREVAATRAIRPPEALATMGDGEIIDLIFAPGFSTATQVTGLSGRGVGMDAVRNSVERLGGRVAIESRPGQGTTIRLTLPFTVMMTRVMTIEAAGQVFGLPLDMVVETAIIPRDQIVPIGRATAFAWRDKTVPLVHLAETLGLAGEKDQSRAARVVITSFQGQFGALEVDRLGERMDVMLKPMDGLLGRLTGVSGTTLLGDGRVLIVLDVQELFS